MRPTINSKAPKKSVNLSINKELLDRSLDLKINLTEALEQVLVEKVSQETPKDWLKRNNQALKNCNELIEKNGLFADKHRAF